MVAVSLSLLRAHVLRVDLEVDLQDLQGSGMGSDRCA